MDEGGRLNRISRASQRIHDVTPRKSMAKIIPLPKLNPE